MSHGHNHAIDVLLTVWFAGMSKVVMLLDFQYADSVFISPLQHLVSIAAGLVAIVVGAPVAYKHLVTAYNWILNLIKK